MFSDLVAKEFDFILLKPFHYLGAISQFDLIYELDAHELPSLYISCISILVMVILTFAERRLKLFNHLILIIKVSFDGWSCGFIFFNNVWSCDFIFFIKFFFHIWSCYFTVVYFDGIFAEKTIIFRAIRC